MCGIVGVVDLDGRSLPDPRLVHAMSALCAHRGPDDHGEWFSERVALAHRRLSIIDLSERGRQPMTDATARLVVAYNGEIYNFPDLKDELVRRGHTFRTSTDTEVILNGYLEWGLLGMLDRVEGMFAILLYDRRDNRFFACRDRFGEKPLYVRSESGRLLFASELRALWEVGPGLSLDWESLDYYLSELTVPQPHTIWREIRQVRPGHVMSVDVTTGRVTEAAYWELPAASKLTIDERDATAETWRLLTLAVQKRTVADRQVGAFLSGGIDSGLVVACLAKSGGPPVRTFAVGFGGHQGDELPAARALAARYGTAHTEVVLDLEVESLLPRLVEAFGEPFADSSAIPTFLVCRELRKHVTVALGGDGGDETFGGYFDYPLARRADVLAQRHPSRPVRQMLRVGSAVLRRVGRSTLRHGEPSQYLDWTGSRRLYRRMGFDPARRADLYAPNLSDARPGFAAAWLDGAWDDSERLEPTLADTLFRASLSTRLLNDYLVKMDRVSMIHALEVRSPFLDRSLVEFAARLPASLKLREERPKYLLRRLARSWVHTDAMSAPKSGFSLPLAAWLKDRLYALVAECLLSGTFARRRLFRPEVARNLVREHREGRADHAHRIWLLLCLELWCRRFLDQTPPARPTESTTSPALLNGVSGPC